MTGQARMLLVLSVGLMAITALLLNRLKSMQRLGAPGVRVVSQPVYDERGALAGTNAVFFPERVLAFESRAVPITRVELDWLPPDTLHGRRLYRAPSGFEVLLVGVLMGTDRTSIHKPQQCLAGQGFSIDQQEPLQVRIDQPHRYDLPVMRLTATREVTTSAGGKARHRALFAYWFVADNQVTADHNQRMWWMARDLLRTGTLQRWAYIGCLATCLPGQEEATWDQMKTFIAAAVPEIQQATLPSLPPPARASVPIGR